MTVATKLLAVVTALLLAAVIWLVVTRSDPERGRSFDEERIACYQGGGDWEQHGALVVGCSHD